MGRDLIKKNEIVHSRLGSSPSPPFRTKKQKKRIVQREGPPTPAPPVKTSEPGLAEESTKVGRLEQENRETKTKADEVAEAKRKLEDELIPGDTREGHSR